MQVYDLAGQKKGRLTVPESCRLAALAYTGQFILAAGMTSQRLFLLNSAGQTLASNPVDQEIIALALTPLGDQALLALADGSLVQMKITKSRG